MQALLVFCISVQESVTYLYHSLQFKILGVKGFILQIVNHKAKLQLTGVGSARIRRV